MKNLTKMSLQLKL